MGSVLVSPRIMAKVKGANSSGKLERSDFELILIRLMRLWSGRDKSHSITLNSLAFHSSYIGYVIIACEMLGERFHDILHWWL